MTEETMEMVTVEGMGDVPVNYQPTGYINRDLVVEMGDTLMGIHPGAAGVGKIGMRAVAQLALITGANPLPGTNGIHVWKDNKDKICIQFGMGFLRGEVEKAGGILWAQRPRPMTKEERESWGVTANDVASYCKAALKRDAYELMATMRSMGVPMPLKEAIEQVAAEGVGVAGTEKWGSGGDYKEAKNGRPLQWTADERAERDLLRKLVPVLREARDNIVNGTYQRGGMGWDVSEFAHVPAGEKATALPEMTDDEWNAALFDANALPDDDMPLQPSLIEQNGAYED